MQPRRGQQLAPMRPRGRCFLPGCWPQYLPTPAAPGPLPGILAASTAGQHQATPPRLPHVTRGQQLGAVPGCWGQHFQAAARGDLPSGNTSQHRRGPGPLPGILTASARCSSIRQPTRRANMRQQGQQLAPMRPRPLAIFQGATSNTNQAAGSWLLTASAGGSSIRGNQPAPPRLPGSNEQHNQGRGPGILTASTAGRHEATPANTAAAPSCNQGPT